MYKAVAKINLEGTRKAYCRECLKRLVERRIMLATGKEADFTRCNKCKRQPNLVIRLNLGYDSEGVPGLYCPDCIDVVVPLDIL
jgi:recombinational DNA repair protein (RecF pathway)